MHIFIFKWRFCTSLGNFIARYAIAFLLSVNKVPMRHFISLLLINGELLIFYIDCEACHLAELPY